MPNIRRINFHFHVGQMLSGRTPLYTKIKGDKVVCNSGDLLALWRVAGNFSQTRKNLESGAYICGEVFSTSLRLLTN